MTSVTGPQTPRGRACPERSTARGGCGGTERPRMDARAARARRAGDQCTSPAWSCNVFCTLTRNTPNDARRPRRLAPAARPRATGRTAHPPPCTNEHDGARADIASHLRAVTREPSFDSSSQGAGGPGHLAGRAGARARHAPTARRSRGAAWTWTRSRPHGSLDRRAPSARSRRESHPYREAPQRASGAARAPGSGSLTARRGTRPRRPTGCRPRRR